MKHAKNNGRTPRARRKALEIQKVGNELLVYDLERHRAHALSPLASLVFQHCDGKTDLKNLSRLIARKLAISADPELVRLVLARLAKARLLEERYRPSNHDSRRDFVSKLERPGLAASMMLPVVTSPINGYGGMPDCTPCEDFSGRCLTLVLASRWCGC